VGTGFPGQGPDTLTAVTTILRLPVGGGKPKYQGENAAFKPKNTTPTKGTQELGK